MIIIITNEEKKNHGKTKSINFGWVLFFYWIARIVPVRKAAVIDANHIPDPQ
jgi:hypothetical protein